METVSEQAVRLGIELPDPDKLTHRTCEKCGKRHRALCRTSPLPDKSRVINEIAVLEREQFKYADNEQKRADINEARKLAEEQVVDDVYNIAGGQRESIGRHSTGWVRGRNEFHGDEEPLWRNYTEEQLALERGFAPFLDRLTADQRVIVRMRYGQEMMPWTEREIATAFNITQPAAHYRLETIHRSVSRMLTEAFGGEEGL